MCKLCCYILQRLGILSISCKKKYFYYLYVGITSSVLSISEIRLALWQRGQLGKTSQLEVATGTSFLWELLFCLVAVFLSYLDPIHIMHSSKSKKNLLSFHIYISTLSIAFISVSVGWHCYLLQCSRKVLS